MSDIKKQIKQSIDIPKDLVLMLKNLRLKRQVAMLTIEKHQLIIQSIDREEAELAEKIKSQLGSSGKITIDLDAAKAFTQD